MNFHMRSGPGLSAPGRDGSAERRRPQRSGGWKLTHRLWGTFGIMVVVLFASGLTGIWLVMRIEENVVQIVEIEEPLEQAVLEMEINAGETARAVLDYIQDFEPHALARIKDSEHDFERYTRQFERLAETDEERVLGEKVANIYREFKTLGDQITSLAKRRSDDLGIFLKDVEIIDALIDDKLQPAIERTAPDALTKLEAALDMEINIHEAFAAIEGYVLHPDPQLRQKIADSEADFERFEAQYRATRLTADEMKWLDQIDKAFAEAVTAGNEIIRLTDTMREKLQRFEADLEEIDHILDDQIQPLIHIETIKAADNAKDSVQKALLVLMVLSLGGALIGGMAVWTMRKAVTGFWPATRTAKTRRPKQPVTGRTTSRNQRPSPPGRTGPRPAAGTWTISSCAIARLGTGTGS